MVGWPSPYFLSSSVIGTMAKGKPASKVNSWGTPALETQLLLRMVLRFVMIGFTYPGRLP